MGAIALHQPLLLGVLAGTPYWGCRVGTTIGARPITVVSPGLRSVSALPLENLPSGSHQRSEWKSLIHTPYTFAKMGRWIFMENFLRRSSTLGSISRARTGGHHIVSHCPVFVQPHGNNQHVIAAYKTVRGLLPGCVGLPASASLAWKWKHRVCITDSYLKATGLCDACDWFSVRQAYFYQITVRTKRYSDDGSIDSGLLYGHAWRDFGCSIRFTRTREERNLTRRLAEVKTDIPTVVRPSDGVNISTLCLDRRVPASFRFLAHGRGQGGRSHNHAQFNEYTRNATHLVRCNTSWWTTTIEGPLTYC